MTFFLSPSVGPSVFSYVFEMIGMGSCFDKVVKDFLSFSYGEFLEAECSICR